MINDMIYSPEQAVQHYWEGFPTHTVNVPSFTSGNLRIANASNTDITVAYGDGANYKFPVQNSIRDELIRWMNQGSSPGTIPFIGETAFHNITEFLNTDKIGDIGPVDVAVDYNILVDWQYMKECLLGKPVPILDDGGPGYAIPSNGSSISFDPALIGSTDKSVLSALLPLTFAYHELGVRVPTSVVARISKKNVKVAGTNTMNFIIPIYSGVIGLLMPEKKLIPLSLLPLAIEIFFNKHALYSSLSNGSRDYTISNLYLYANTMFFEQEI